MESSVLVIESGAAAAADAASNQRAWAIAIFAAREAAADLFATIEAALAAGARSERTVIDVLVNGNPELAAAAAGYARSLPMNSAGGPLLRVWSIALGDKAHAWNEYLHRIWPGSAIAFFIDGYVRLRPDALELLARGMLGSPGALGGSGVPSMGRDVAATRREMTTEGGFHGNCCCISRVALLELRSRRFHFPLGLYRVDALLGAVLAYRMDPARHKWDFKSTIFVEPQASWTIDPKRWWRLSDFRAALKRRTRQAQGRLENLAIRDHLSLRRRLPEELPATAAQLVLDWAERCPDAAREASKDRRVAQALEQFSVPRDWSAAQVEPVKRFTPDDPRLRG